VFQVRIIWDSLATRPLWAHKRNCQPALGPPRDSCRSLLHGGWLDLHHSVQGLRPNPVKPHPQEPVRAEQSWTARALAPQDRPLMPKGDELEFEGGATTKTEREQGDEGRKNRDHANDARAEAQ
jgi:hypothetical protein